MEPINQTASRALSSERSEPRAANSELPELVAWLWQQLVTMYGPSFLTAYAVNDAPPKLWVGALSKLTPDEAKAGIAALSKEGRSYPPNLTEVLEACRPKKRVRYLGGPSSRYKALPPPAADMEHVDGCLESMRRVVGKVAPREEEVRRPARACTCTAQGTCETCRYFAGVS